MASRGGEGSGSPARIADGGEIQFEAEVTGLDGLTSDRPAVHYRQATSRTHLTCDIVAGWTASTASAGRRFRTGVLTTYDHVFRSAGSASCRNPADQGNDLRQS